MVVALCIYFIATVSESDPKAQCGKRERYCSGCGQIYHNCFCYFVLSQLLSYQSGAWNNMLYNIYVYSVFIGTDNL